MKNILLLLFISLSTITLSAQEKVVVIKPKEEKPNATPVKTKTAPVKTKIIYVDRPSTNEGLNKATIKFLCDENALLFIDGEKKGVLKTDTPLRINLPQGDYKIKVVNPKDENDFLKWNYSVTEIGVEKLEEIRFKKTSGTNKQNSQKETSKNKAVKTDLEDLNLLGKIKSTTTNTYLLNKKKSGVEKGKSTTTTTVIFDEKGNIIERNINSQKTIYKHDEQGKIVNSLTYDSPNAVSKFIGLIAKKVSSQENSETNKSLGNLISKISYDYDENNQYIGYATYTAEGKITSRIKMKRDENGHLYESKTIDVNNNLASSVIYDKKEHYIEMDQYDVKGSVVNKFLYFWDENDNNTESEYYQYGKLISKTTSKYDDRNHVIETSTTMPSISNTATIAKFSNEYDGIGNLIKTTSDSSIVEVIIAYY